MTTATGDSYDVGVSIPDHIPGLHFYDKTGAEVTLAEHMKLFEDPEYKQVGLWRDGDVTVSTVWLGFDAGILTRVPQPFETMVFTGGDAGPVWRYPTEAAALAGHDQIVAWVKDGHHGDLPTVE
jgi:hypothetical protein